MINTDTHPGNSTVPMLGSGIGGAGGMVLGGWGWGWGMPMCNAVSVAAGNGGTTAEMKFVASAIPVSSNLTGADSKPIVPLTAAVSRCRNCSN